MNLFQKLIENYLIRKQKRARSKKLRDIKNSLLNIKEIKQVLDRMKLEETSHVSSGVEWIKIYNSNNHTILCVDYRLVALTSFGVGTEHFNLHNFIGTTYKSSKKGIKYKLTEDELDALKEKLTMKLLSQ